ncbi:MAG TPA: hypothetical protein VKV34_02845 [Thermoleophilia bacterium]|nr:hypothetical protein [Thermoleophilia bacterium]
MTDAARLTRGHRAASAGEPIAVLRGAGVSSDTRRVSAALAGLVVVALVASGVTLLVANFERKAQLDLLRHHGVAVTIDVTACRGLLGGSGSNLAGFACVGTYRLGGRSYVVKVPGTAAHSPGERVAAVAVVSEPGLVSTRQLLAGHATASSEVVAVVLLAVALALGLLAGRRLRGRSGDGRDGPGASSGTPPG